MRARRETVLMLAVARAAILSLPLMPSSARAQDLPLAQVLPDLVLREIVLQRGTIGPSHIAHFSPLSPNGSDPQNPVIGIVQGFNTQMATQFATFPLGSSSGGLTYVFDESVGTFRRGSASFGPLFAERALTIGRGKLNAGFNYQRTSYNTFEGQNLDDGSIKFYLRHQDCCHFANPANLTGFTLTPLNASDTLNPPFKGDIIEASLFLQATTHTAVAFANYGVTDRWDIGLAVPSVRVNLDARVRARIIRLVTCQPLALDPTAIQPPECAGAHAFEPGNPNATLTIQRSGRATGFGDIVIRTKYHFLRMAGGGLAAAVDLRLPTGDEDNLLGAGGTQAKFLLVASDERGRFGRHANIGYTVSRGDVAGTVAGLSAASLPNEFNYTGGVEFIANPRVTVTGDVVGRTLRGAGRLELASQSFEYIGFTPTSFMPGAAPGCGGFLGTVCLTASFDALTPQAGNLTLLLGTGGVKYNLAGNLLVSGSVLFPLTKAGLRSHVTTVIGVDYAF
jgi:hypothetical protein